MPAVINRSGIIATPLFAEAVLEANIVQSNGATKPFVNVFHFVQTTPTPAAGVATTLRDEIINILEASLEAALSIAYTNGTVKVRFMDDPTSAFSAASGDIDGAVSNDRATSFNAATIQLKTDARGRNYKGSKHFGPIAESHTTLDWLNAGAITLWNDVVVAINAMQDGIDGGNGTTWGLIVLSQVLSDLEASPSIFTYARLQEAVLNKIVGSMRRRKEKGAVTA